MAQRLELHAAKTGNCLRVAMALEEAGLPYDLRRVDFGSGAHLKPAHLALNPLGKVPVLVVHDEAAAPVVLTQSNAILLWIDGRVPGRLLPVAGIARQVALERLFFVLTDVIAPGHAAFRLRRAGIDGDAPAALDDQAVENLAFVEKFLAATPFMAGDAFSLVDIAAFTIASAYAARLDWSKLPHMALWHQTIGGRPAVARGMAAFD